MGQLDKKRKIQARISVVKNLIEDLRNASAKQFNGKKKQVIREMYENELVRLQQQLANFNDDEYAIMMADYNRYQSIQSAANRFFARNIEAIQRVCNIPTKPNVVVDIELTILNGNSFNLPKDRHYSKNGDERKEFKAKLRNNGKHTVKLKGSRGGIEKAKMMIAKKLLKNQVSPLTIKSKMNDFDQAVDSAIAEIEYERIYAINEKRRKTWNERRLSKGMREAH